MRNRMLTGSYFEHEQRVYSSQLEVLVFLLRG